MNVEEIIEMYKNGKISAPLGTKGFMIFYTDPDGTNHIVGNADKDSALSIGYHLLKAVIEPAEKPRETEEVLSGEVI